MPTYTAMKNILWGITLLACPFLSQAQIENSNLSTQQTVGRINSISYYQYDETTAYLRPDWAPGKVFFLDGTHVISPLNYNALNERVELLNEKGEKWTPNKTIIGFILGGTELGKGSYFQNGYRSAQFYEVLYHGKQGDLLRQIVAKTRAKREFNEANTTVYFDLYENYFLSDTNGQLTPVKRTKKFWSTLTPASNKVLTDTQNKLDSWEKVMDLLEAVGY